VEQLGREAAEREERVQLASHLTRVGGLRPYMERTKRGGYKGEVGPFEVVIFEKAGRWGVGIGKDGKMQWMPRRVGSAELALSAAQGQLRALWHQAHPEAFGAVAAA
jgi:hypothetical protein